MKNLILLFSIFTLSLCFSTNVFGQKSVDDLNINDFPHYIIITTENTKLLGGIDIVIDYKKSKYEDALDDLETILQSRKKMKIRNQTDLLNAMWEFGYEYVDAYNANAGTLGGQAGDDLELVGSNSKFRTNMVFKKTK